MQHVVLATAGHIDHGKTELTRALTGIDTDRLPEEKERGITIDLGFAHAEIAGRRVAVVDVPGHERFVKNMLAGVGGLDCALLVVAADESVMPQTREHVAILELLGVERGLIAVSKCDLVDEEVRELVRLELQEFVQSTFLEDAPVVEVSARTGEGMKHLRAELETLLAGVAARDATGPFRLPVDRAFSVHGFGAVVTGTVWSGSVSIGDEVEVSPSGVIAKVRGIEVHGDEASSVQAGARAALNLAGVNLDETARGSQLVPPRRYRAGAMIDVRLRLLDDAPTLTDLDRVRVHLGAAEVMARLRLLEGPELAPGGEMLAQLRMERALLAWPGDRFIVRRYSPMQTIGGGHVVDVLVAKHRGRPMAVVEQLRTLDGAPLARRVAGLVQAAEAGVDLSTLVARTGRNPADVAAALDGSDQVVRVDGVEPRYFSTERWRAAAETALELLREFHEREPLLEGMSRQELCVRLFRDDPVSARRRLDALASDGSVKFLGDRVAWIDHEVRLEEEDVARMAAIERALQEGGLSPPPIQGTLDRAGKRGERLLGVLLRSGRAVALTGGLYYHADAIAEVKRRLHDGVAADETFSVARFKELTGTSRKYAIPLLEHLDSVRFTRRQGDDRVLIEQA